VSPLAPLLDHVPACLFAWSAFRREEDPEVLVLRSRKDWRTGKADAMDYTDTATTRRLRRQVHRINRYLSAAPIFLLPDAMARTDDGQPLDPTRRTVRRIFNNGNWDQGGRLYGAFWETMRREDRFRLLRIGTGAHPEGEPIANVAGRTDKLAAMLDQIIGSPASNATVFVVFVFVGSVFIVMSKFSGMAQSLITLVPVGIIIAYALSLWGFRALRLRDDQSGDNIYYMGFLFTLVSLAVSLYQFTASRASEEIVQNFGIAIASTIAGIAARVVFNQLRQDPIEVERIARLELADAARRVRRELDSTVLEFAYFRRSTQQATIEAFEELRVRVDEVGRTVLRGLEEVTAKAAAPLEAASRTSSATLEELTRTAVAALQGSAQELGTQTDRVATGARAIASSLDVVREKLTAMQTPDRVIELRIEPTIQALTGAVDNFSTRAEHQTAALQTILEAVRECTDRCAGILTGVRDGSAANSEEMRQLVEQMRRATLEIMNAITLMREGAQTRESVAEEALAIARRSVEQMTGSAESFKADVAGHLEQVRAMLDERDRRSEQWSQTQTQIALRQETTLAAVASNLAEFTRIAEIVADRAVASAQQVPVGITRLWRPRA
jgi:hypothetical protein